MVRVKFGKNDDQRVLVMQVKGHAQYASPGKDIVCAAASILALTAAQDVTDAFNDGLLTGKPEIRLKEGATRILLQAATDQAYAGLLHTFFIIEKGFLCLQKASPAHVKVMPNA